MRLEIQYRINLDSYFAKYYIAQYKVWWWPFWITIKHDKMPWLNHLTSWHREETEAQQTCIQHKNGIRWKKFKQEKPEFPKNLDI